MPIGTNGIQIGGQVHTLSNSTVGNCGANGIIDAAPNGRMSGLFVGITEDGVAAPNGEHGLEIQTTAVNMTLRDSTVGNSGECGITHAAPHGRMSELFIGINKDGVAAPN